MVTIPNWRKALLLGCGNYGKRAKRADNDGSYTTTASLYSPNTFLMVSDTSPTVA